MATDKTPAQVWSNAPEAPVLLAQELKENGVVIFTGEVDCTPLWSAPVENLRGYAHKALVLDAQKRVKAQLASVANNAADPVKYPKVLEAKTISQHYADLLSEFPSIQGITSSAGAAKADPYAAVAAQTAELDPAEKIAKLVAAGILSEAEGKAMLKLQAKG